MAIFNLQDSVLFCTKQKNSLQQKATSLQMQILAASRQSAKSAQDYAKQLQDLYYDDEFGHDSPEYAEMYEALTKDHEAESAELAAWEQELLLEKDSIETQIQELTKFEDAWEKMLKKDISSDFTYGGGK